MYTLADRMKAVELYLKYDRRSATVRRELGYLSKRALRPWVEEFESTGALHAGYRARPPRYSNQQKQAAVDHYLQHGRSQQRTVNALGYPSRQTLNQWLDEAVPDRRMRRTGKAGQNKVKLTRRQKERAVKDLCLRDGPAREVASKHRVTREALYKWKSDLFGKEHPVSKARRRKPRHDAGKTDLEAKIEALQQEVRTLEDEIHRLQLERDILAAAADVLKKKDQGTDLEQLTNREKAVVVGALRERYRLNELLDGLSSLASPDGHDDEVLFTHETAHYLLRNGLAIPGDHGMIRR